MDVITENLSSLAKRYGYEAHPFKIGWYNDTVSHASFRFNLPYDTLSYIIISTPKMFDLAFKQYLQRDNASDTTNDAIDNCTKYFFELFMQEFPNNDIEAIYDFDMHANHRPKVLVQTCAHVAGAARYYQRCDVLDDPWPKTRRIYGVSVHPKYGGWFAMRGILIFNDVQCPDMKQKPPPIVLTSDEEICQILERFCTNWMDSSYRDVSPYIEERYSEEQLTYFITPPNKRGPLLDRIKQNLKF